MDTPLKKGPIPEARPSRIFSRSSLRRKWTIVQLAWQKGDLGMILDMWAAAGGRNSPAECTVGILLSEKNKLFWT